MISELSGSQAAGLARIVLGHVTRSYPHKLDHVLLEGGEILAPDVLHPLFYGSFDWHSCVHSYWSLARLLLRFPEMEAAGAIADLFDRQFTAGNVAAELAYFKRPAARGFERPYGWAWLVKLAAELDRHRDRPWAAELEPLAGFIRDQFRRYLPLATYPVRAGTHGNTAFALLLAADDAAAAGDDPFSALLQATALRWYGRDRDCQAWEPGGDDFLSPALIEAACMERLLPRQAFRTWLEGFLPRIAVGEPAALFTPAEVTDRSDGKPAHLDGLNLSRAWCWRLMAAALDPGDPRRPAMLEAASRHLAAGLRHLSSHYTGEHWLATFALLAFEAASDRPAMVAATEGG